MCKRNPRSLCLQCLLLKAFVQCLCLNVWLVYAAGVVYGTEGASR